MGFLSAFFGGRVHESCRSDETERAVVSSVRRVCRGRFRLVVEETKPKRPPFWFCVILVRRTERSSGLGPKTELESESFSLGVLSLAQARARLEARRLDDCERAVRNRVVLPQVRPQEDREVIRALFLKAKGTERVLTGPVPGGVLFSGGNIIGECHA